MKKILIEIKSNLSEKFLEKFLEGIKKHFTTVRFEKKEAENLIETSTNDHTAVSELLNHLANSTIKKAFESGWVMGHDSGCANETMYGTTIGEDWKRYLSRSKE